MKRKLTLDYIKKLEMRLGNLRDAYARSVFRGGYCIQNISDNIEETKLKLEKARKVRK